MPLIEWTNELSVGIDSIDKQHKELVDIINCLDETIPSLDSREELRKIFAELASYTKKHFVYEEKLFEKYGYKEGIEHKRQHDELIVQLVELKEKFDHYQQECLTNEVMAFLKNWLTYHIKESDKAYSQFLRAQGMK